MIEPVDILAFSPHPDDAELGCGGSLLLCALKGCKVAVADMSEGEHSSRGTPSQRNEEKSMASGLIGLSARLSLGLQDTGIGLDPAHLQTVIDIIREVRPRIVLAPYWKDRHPDHESAGKLIREACFFSGVSSKGLGVPYRPEAVYYYMIHSPFEPSFVVDISPVWDKKCEVLNAYRSQFYGGGDGQNPTAISNTRFLRYHEARCIFFGAMTGAAYGEPYFCQGPLSLNSLPGQDSVRQADGGQPSYKSF
jgi:N-acetylglucosamine malate deacetylase 1